MTREARRSGTRRGLARARLARRGEASSSTVRRPRRAARPRWGRIVALLAAVLAVAGIGVVPRLALPAVRGRRRRAGAGGGAPRVEPRADRGAARAERGVVSSSTFFQLRARLAGRTDDLKPGALHPAQGHELRRGPGRARGGGAAQHRAGHDARGALAERDRRRGGARPARELHGGQPALAACSIRATTGRRGRGAWRASCSRPPTSCAAACPCVRLVDRQLTAFKERFADRGPAVCPEQEPHSLRRARSSPRWSSARRRCRASAR